MCVCVCVCVCVGGGGGGVGQNYSVGNLLRGGGGGVQFKGAAGSGIFMLSPTQLLHQTAMIVLVHE